MTAYQQQILRRLDEFGWELAAREDLELWWADDAWRLRSVWSPRECEVYVTFLVDPQVEIRNRKPGERVWAAKASATRPATWQKADGDHVLDFSRGWEQRVVALFSHLAQLRRNHTAGGLP